MSDKTWMIITRILACMVIVAVIVDVVLWVKVFGWSLEVFNFYVHL